MTLPPPPGATPLRIGLVTPAWPGTRTANGIATAVSHVRSGLEAVGCMVVVIALSADCAVADTRVVFVQEPRRSLWGRLCARLDPWAKLRDGIGKRIAQAVNEAVRRHGIEIVVMEESFGWAGTVQKHVEIPVVATLHGPWFLHKALHGAADVPDDWQREASEAAALREVKGITSPSLNVLQLTREAYSLPEDMPQAVIRNPMPLGNMGEGEEFDATALERILFVGRFDYHKGGDVILEAFNRLSELHPTCRLTFVGPHLVVQYPDGNRLELKSAISRLAPAAKARLEVLGPQGRDEVAALRKSHAIAIVASRYENFGGTMTEAMAAGQALVCTAVGGCPEMVSDCETGLLVPSEDPEAIAQACLRLLQDTSLATRLGAAARSQIGRDLAPHIIGTQMVAFLAPICRDWEAVQKPRRRSGLAILR